MKRNVSVVISSMSQPLGYTIGNSLEVKEAIDTLKGNGPSDLTELCLELGSHMLVLGNVASNKEEGRQKLIELINSGKAFEKFREFVELQGGDLECIDQVDLLPEAQFSVSYTSKNNGFISEINALNIGLASVKLGAGRETKESEIDFGAGIKLKKKIGDYIKQDETLAVLYSNNERNLEKSIMYMDQAYKITNEKPIDKPLILKTMQ